MSDVPPETAEAWVALKAGYPYCSACGKRLQHESQNRCPYVQCRRWLRSKFEQFAPGDKKGKERA